MKIVSAKIIKPIPVYEHSNISFNKIIIDTKSRPKNRTHQLLYQQGSYYGNVGDVCDYATDADLLRMEKEGLLLLAKKGKITEG